MLPDEQEMRRRCAGDAQEMWTSEPYIAGSQGEDIVSLHDLLMLIQNLPHNQRYDQR